MSRTRENSREERVDLATRERAMTSEVEIFSCFRNHSLAKLSFVVIETLCQHLSVTDYRTQYWTFEAKRWFIFLPSPLDIRATGKPVSFGIADDRALVRRLALRENSSELFKEFQSARKTGNSRPRRTRTRFPPTCLCVGTRALAFSAFSCRRR